MATEGVDERYLVAREMDMWRAEADRAQKGLEALQRGGPEAVAERAWYDYCYRKYEAVAREVDKIEHPQIDEVTTVRRAHESLDDLDRQTE